MTCPKCQGVNVEECPDCDGWLDDEGRIRFALLPDGTKHFFADPEPAQEQERI